jgi:murein DD-endopeptidase MepM/ murein hydrolase activator NlpD
METARTQATPESMNHAPGWTVARRSNRPPARILLILLLLPLVAGLFAAPAAPGVRGDELTDAIAARKAAEQKAAEQKAEIERLNALQAGLKADIDATARALRQVNADLAAVRKQITAMAAKIEEVRRQIAELTNRLQIVSAQVPRIEAEERTKAAELEERKAMLAARIREAYSTERTSLLETFLSGDSFTDILTEVGYHIDVGEQDRALAQQIVRDQETLAALHAIVVATRDEVATLKAETEKQKAELDARLLDLQAAQNQLKQLEAQTARALASQKAAYAQMARNKAAAEKAVAQAAAAQRALQSKIDQIIRERREYGNIPSQYNGTLAWPLAGSVTQNFGCTGFSWEPPRGSCPHFHSGIDIAAPMYAPITAAGDGVVVFAGPNPYDDYPKAWIVIIAHSETMLTWYGHVDNAVKPPVVSAGDNVAKGQVIAYVGMTGRTTGPHLHWMVEHNDEFTNPRLYV